MTDPLAPPAWKVNLMPEKPANDWLARLVKAERENHCGDKACMTRRVSAAVRVLTGGKEHQDYCWAVEAFEAELGIRDPALVGAEPSNAMLAASSPVAPQALDAEPALQALADILGLAEGEAPLLENYRRTIVDRARETLRQYGPPAARLGGTSDD